MGCGERESDDGVCGWVSSERARVWRMSFFYGGISRTSQNGRIRASWCGEVVHFGGNEGNEGKKGPILLIFSGKLGWLIRQPPIFFKVCLLL